MCTMDDVDLQACFSLFFICVISTTLIWSFLKSTRDKPHLPPSPFALPIIGHLRLLTPTAHQAFHKISLRYGPVFRIIMGSVPCVGASSPEMAKDFLKTFESSYLDRPHNSALAYLTYGSKDFAFVPFGSYWKFMKKIVLLRLLNGTTLDLLLSVRKDEIKHLIKSLSEKANAGEAVDLSVELTKLTNNVISRMLMSKRCSDKENEATDMRNLVTEINKTTGKFNLSDYIWIFRNLDLQGFGKRLMDIRNRYDALIERIIKEHEVARKQETGELKDLLSHLLEIAENGSTEIKLSRENIKSIILNMFSAGTDTSALTTEWDLAELINHPNSLKVLGFKI